MKEEEYDPLWCDHCGLKESQYLEYKKERGLKEGDCPGCKMLTPEQIKEIEKKDRMMSGMDGIQIGLSQYMISGKYIYIKAKFLLDKFPNVLDYRIHKNKHFCVDISVDGNKIDRYETWINSSGVMNLTKFFNDLNRRNEIIIGQGDTAIINTVEKNKEYEMDIIKPT